MPTTSTSTTSMPVETTSQIEIDAQPSVALTQESTGLLETEEKFVMSVSLTLIRLNTSYEASNSDGNVACRLTRRFLCHFNDSDRFLHCLLLSPEWQEEIGIRVLIAAESCIWTVHNDPTWWWGASGLFTSPRQRWKWHLSRLFNSGLRHRSILSTIPAGGCPIDTHPHSRPVDSTWEVVWAFSLFCFYLTFLYSTFQYNPVAAQKLVSSQLMSNGYYFAPKEPQLNSTQMETSLSDLNSYNSPTSSSNEGNDDSLPKCNEIKVTSDGHHTVQV